MLIYNVTAFQKALMRKGWYLRELANRTGPYCPNGKPLNYRTVLNFMSRGRGTNKTAVILAATLGMSLDAEDAIIDDGVEKKNKSIRMRRSQPAAERAS